MGFLRKAIIISTGGLAPIKSQSYRERTANAAEKQLHVQQQMLREQQSTTAPISGHRINCPYCNRALTARAGVIRCSNCSGKIKVRANGDALRTR